MSRRTIGWAIVCLLGLAALSPFDPPVVGRGGMILLILLTGLLGALAGTLIPRVAVRGSDRPTDGEPADGLVPLVALKAVKSVPNPDRAEIRRFLAGDWDGIELRSRAASPTLRLEGRVAIFSLFVGRDGCSWSSREIAGAYDSCFRVGRWLEKEAARWDAPVNFEVIDTYFSAEDDHDETVELSVVLDPYENTIDEVDVDLRGIASASRAAARLGFADVTALMARMDGLVDHDTTVWFVHLLREGRSRAVRADRLALPGVGLALCYARESSASARLAGRPYVDPVTLTHELLHLFGASDKYGTPLSTFPRHTVTSRDIMRLDHDRLGRLRIDSLTAFEIGWVSSPSRPKENRPASTRA